VYFDNDQKSAAPKDAGKFAELVGFAQRTVSDRCYRKDHPHPQSPLFAKES
jgi:hypothetical protein